MDKNCQFIGSYLGGAAGVIPSLRLRKSSGGSKDMIADDRGERNFMFLVNLVGGFSLASNGE